MSIRLDLASIEQKSDIPALKQRIEGISADVVIYTDGSCKGGISDGGAAAIISDNNFDAPTIIKVIMKKGNKITCSYREEHRALNLGLEWLDSASNHTRILFCTDSLCYKQIETPAGGELYLPLLWSGEFR